MQNALMKGFLSLEVNELKISRDWTAALYVMSSMCNFTTNNIVKTPSLALS